MLLSAQQYTLDQLSQIVQTDANTISRWLDQWLPPYCPHLNKVETLWRMVKYRWLAPRDYASFETLCKGVENILSKVGQEYRISFA